MGYKEGWEKRRLNGFGKASEETKKKLSAVRKAMGVIPPNWKGKKRSPESVERSASKRRGQARPDMKGDKNTLWKGGITPVNAQLRTSLEYKNWRRAVFTRDNFTCQDGGKRGGELHADHILPFSAYPATRLEISNGQTLCKDCHKNTDSYLSQEFEKCPVYAFA